MAIVIPFALLKPEPLMLRYCDKPDCVRCKHRSEWTNQDYEESNERDRQWMVVKGFRYGTKSTS